MRGVRPFDRVMFVVLVRVTCVPPIPLWLPRLLGL